MRRSARGRRPAGFILLALALAVGPPLRAQGAPSRLLGRVVEAASGTPVAGAEVALVDGRRRATTDSTGRFALVALPPGLRLFRVRAPGHLGADILVNLRPGAEVERIVTLEPERATGAGQALAPVTVSATRTASYRLSDFERRRRTGRGHYLTEDEILRMRAASLLDATRGLRGVTQVCGGRSTGGDGGCRLHMARARRNCSPDYVVDGRVDNMFGATTPIRDVVALEVYTGPSDVPGEFAGTTAGCGVVVIWTRAEPRRRE